MNAAIVNFSPNRACSTTRHVFGRAVTDTEFPQYKQKLLATLQELTPPTYVDFENFDPDKVIIQQNLCSVHERIKNPILGFLFGRLYNAYQKRQDAKRIGPILSTMTISNNSIVLHPTLDIHRRPFQEKWTRFWNAFYEPFHKHLNARIRDQKVPTHISQKTQNTFRIFTTQKEKPTEQFDIKGIEVVANPDFKISQ